MFLYDKNGESIDVFTFNERNEELRQYKINEMSKIPIDKRCLYTEEIVTTFQATPILLKKDLYTEEISTKDLIGKNKSLNYYTDLKDAEDLLELYYSDNYTYRPVARLRDLKKLRYLLVASNYNHIREENNKITMKVDDIIEIPKSLYLLQLLQQQKFSTIINEDLSEQLNLFDFSYINNITLEKINKMDACGATNNIYSNIINKSNNDKHILKLLKK